MSINKQLSLLLCSSLSLYLAGCSSVAVSSKSGSDAPVVMAKHYGHEDVSFDWSGDSVLDGLNLRGQVEGILFDYLSRPNTPLLGYQSADRSFFQVLTSSVSVTSLAPDPTNISLYGKSICFLSVTISGREVHYSTAGSVVHDGYVIFEAGNAVSNLGLGIRDAAPLVSIPMDKMYKQCGFTGQDVKRAVLNLKARGV